MRIGNHHFDACVNSRAIYTLMSKWVYDLLSHKEVGSCEESNIILMGASGKTIPTYGFTCIHFGIGKLGYEYPILVGHLKGVDFLLGLKWLIAV